MVYLLWYFLPTNFDKIKLKGETILQNLSIYVDIYIIIYTDTHNQHTCKGKSRMIHDLSSPMIATTKN